MLAKREELTDYLRHKCDFIVFNKDKCLNICTGIKEKHDIPSSTVMDLISGRREISLATDFELYCLTEEINYSLLKKYFTEIEINNFSKTKWKDPKKFSLPFSIPCHPLGNNGWLGTIEVDELIKMYSQQFVIYNENTQRVLKQMVHGGEVVWTIQVNKKSLREIQECLHSDTYIPTVLTFNINDEDADFYYDEDKKELVLKELKGLDIIDGYHRYLALCNEKVKDPDFKFTMGVFIVNYSEEKARQYIFQEDQKTKMKKMDAASMNTTADENIIIEKLNSDMNSNLQGCISRNEGIIKYSIISQLIRQLYYTGKIAPKANEKRTYRLNLIKELKGKFNLITDEHPELLESPITTKELLVYMTAMKEIDDIDELLQIIQCCIDNKEELNEIDIVGNTINKRCVNKAIEFWSKFRR